LTTVVSLFSGCGGFDLGYIDQGLDVIAAYDVDKSAVDAYRRNVSEIIIQRDLSVEDINIPASDIVIAGPPCQGFSSIGKQELLDPRNLLLEKSCKIALSKRPKFIVIENVVGLISKKNKTFLDNIASMLTCAGYFVDVQKIHCEEYGLPQRRRRVFVFARRDSAPFSPVFNKRAGATVGSVFAENRRADSVGVALLPSHSRFRKIAERIRPGQKLCNVRDGETCVHTWQIPEVFGSVTPSEVKLLNVMIRLRRTERKRDHGDADPVSIERIEKALGKPQADIVQSLIGKSYLKRRGNDVDLVNTFNGTFRRLDNAEVSPTVDTQFGNPRMFLHPVQHRGLSVREASLLQGFHPEYVWPDSENTAFRLIGNAVPPPIATMVAEISRGLLSS
jgi:DNA (cytosine-5)-methyltransferase 1